MKGLVFPKRERKATIGTIRFKLFHIAAKVTQHAKNFQIHLSSSNVYDTLFWQVLQRIQQFQLVWPLKNSIVHGQGVSSSFFCKFVSKVRIPSKLQWKNGRRSATSETLPSFSAELLFIKKVWIIQDIIGEVRILLNLCNGTKNFFHFGKIEKHLIPTP